MAEWHTIRSRLTKEELERISEYKKKHNLNDNQFIRKAIESILGLDFIDKSFLPCLNLLLSVVKEYRKRIKSNSDLELFDKITEQMLRNVAEKETQSFQNKVNPIIPDFNTFKKSRKRGAPKKNRRRGRPKDVGI